MRVVCMLAAIGVISSCQGTPAPTSVPPSPTATAASAAAPSPAATSEPTGASASAAPPSPTAPPPPATAIPAEPGRPTDGKPLWDAPERYDHLIIKVSYPYRAQYRNLRYEGHNRLLRGDATDAEQVAKRWRRLAQGTRAVFLLRDSLWSQQDHPIRLQPYALMMPPCWVTAAVAELAAGHAIRPLVAPALGDDAAWAAIATPADMFGSFPPSDSLFQEATSTGSSDPQQRLRTKAARASLRSLAADVEAMRAAAPRGIEAVAAAGAERIAASDRRYFGAALRYHRVVPIFVENPNRKEFVDEGKGMVPPGSTIAAPLVKLARNAVYLRRLRDGDLAVERYDLSVPAEGARAIEVLEALIPAQGTGKSTLWLWVTGRLDPHRKAMGENATRYLPAFRKQLGAARIDRSRLRIVSKPATELPAGPGQAGAFRRDAKWYRHRDLPYAVKLTTHQLAQLIRAP